MLKLKFQYFGHLMGRTESLQKTLKLGKIEARREGANRRWDGWMASLTWWTWVWVSSGSWCWTGKPGMLQFMGSQRVGHNWATELNWTDKKKFSTDSSYIKTLFFGWLDNSGLRPSFIYWVLAVLGLLCFVGFSLVVENRCYFLVAVRGFLIAMLFLTVEHRL